MPIARPLVLTAGVLKELPVGDTLPPEALAPVLNTVAAATGNQAGIASGNYSIAWNWAKTSDATTAFSLGETAAATGGTSTSGVPNQVLLKLATLAASTMSPLSVYSRGSHVFSVSPTAAQLLAANGSASLPAYSFAADVTTGLYLAAASDLKISVGDSDALRFYNGASNRLIMGSGWYFDFQNGSANTPSINNYSSEDTGLFWPTFQTLSVSIAAVENTRWGVGFSQYSKGSADAVAYAIDARKSRGSVASPTVITTGDGLLAITGYGYVGATNTYLPAARILFESNGAIADTASGIGGRIKFYTRKAGTDTALFPVLYLSGGSSKQVLALDSASPAAPSYSWDGEEDSGFYVPANNTIAVSTGGVLCARFSGVSSPTLTLAGTISTLDPAGGAGSVWKLGVAAIVAPTSPNRTVRVDIAGVTYYLAAKTTND